MRNFTRAFYEITGTLVDRRFWVTVYERVLYVMGSVEGGGGGDFVGRLRDGYANPRLCFELMIQ